MLTPKAALSLDLCSHFDTMLLDVSQVKRTTTMENRETHLPMRCCPRIPVLAQMIRCILPVWALGSRDGR